MSKTIDVEIVIDTVTLLQKYPNPSMNSNVPTGIAHNYGYMVTQSSYVNSGQATGDLSFKALVGDIVRWRSLSLSGNTDQTAVLYDIRRFSGTQVTGDVGANEAKPYAPLPTLSGGHNTNPPTYTVITQPDYYLQASVTDHGTEGYQVFFYVTDTDQNTGKPVVKGYFYWDPTITVA